MALAVHLLRFYSIVLGLGTVYFTYRLARLLFPQNAGLVIAVAAFVAFNPQFIFISAAVTNDNLIIFLSTVALWLLAGLLTTPASDVSRSLPWRPLALALIVGLASLAKLSGLSLLALTLFAFALLALWQRRWRFALTWALVVVAAALLIGGWWYVRNWQLYGDPTGLNRFLELVGPRPSPLTWHNLRSELQSLRVSYLATFGWFNIILPRWVYVLWDLFLAASLVGFIVGLAARRRTPLPISGPALTLLLTWVAVFLLSLLRWTALTPGAQGRLLFPAIAAIAALLMLGWSAWLPRRPGWLAIPPLGLLTIAVLSLPLAILPAYRTPPLISPDDVPAAARIDPIVVDERFRLLGVETTPTTTHPGDAFDLTLYWQAMQPAPSNASLFVHLLGRGNAVVGQLDTYPGWGNFATSLWPVDSVIVDRYRLSIPYTLTTPTLLKVDVGLFDYDTKAPYPSRTELGGVTPLGVAALRILPEQTPTASPQVSAPFVFADRIALDGYDLAAPATRPGAQLDIDLSLAGARACRRGLPGVRPPPGCEGPARRWLRRYPWPRLVAHQRLGTRPTGAGHLPADYS